MEEVNVNRFQHRETSQPRVGPGSISMNLRDLLNVRDNEATTRNGHPNETMTLATVLACEKHNQQPLSSISTNTAGGRTLLDIIRLDEDTRRIIANPVNRQADPVDRPQGIRWKGIKSLLRLRRIPTWPNSSNPTSVVAAASPPTIVNEVGLDWSPTPPQQESEGEPIRPSLMALLEEGDGRNIGGEPSFAATMMGMMDEEDDGNNEEEDDDDESVEIGGKGKGRTYICCVCMIRHKGAAFIPCGHTFCRLCSRELWVSRGNCPLCNCFILEILDIF